MPSNPDTSQRKIALNCLDGQPAPPVVIEGWKAFGGFSSAAWESFWFLLAPVLMDPDSTTNQDLMRLFSQEYNVAPDSILAAMGCFELLLKNAAARDLPKERFQQDIEGLAGGSLDESGEFILSRYADAMQGLRRQILLEALAAHGKVMTGLQWRLDTLKHASGGNNLNTDIVLLTLAYREGKHEGSITLQLTEEAARQLKGFCDRFTDHQKA